MRAIRPEDHTPGQYRSAAFGQQCNFTINSECCMSQSQCICHLLCAHAVEKSNRHDNHIHPDCYVSCAHSKRSRAVKMQAAEQMHHAQLLMQAQITCCLPIACAYAVEGSQSSSKEGGSRAGVAGASGGGRAGPPG